MAHKTLIGGTAYEISGGKTFVGGTAYSIKNGKTLVGGTAYEVGFGGWPDDLDTGLEFASASAFTLSGVTGGYDGTMEYCNGKEWATWDGSEISSGEGENGHYIYLRGTGNTTFHVQYKKSYFFTLTGSAIECNGNIENLLDYATVKAGAHPTMGTACFMNLFRDCTALITAPNLPATTLASSCYRFMFGGCTALTTVPSLPATTLAESCYYGMFSGCTNIKLSSTATGTYTKAYRVPYSGTGTTASNALQNMFGSTGGTFTGTPTINTTYYLDASNTIV